MTATIWIALALYVLLTVLDVVLYVVVVSRHGSQWKPWPGSGFYAWWKHRKTGG